jgi:hypothetical protein
MRKFQKPVRQGTLSVVNMSNDAKISDVLHSVSILFFEGAKVVDSGGFLGILAIVILFNFSVKTA